MKRLITIFGALFLTSLLFTSCGDVNVEDLDKDIESEEDAVEALITIAKAEIELIDKAMAPMQELADMADRSEDIDDASNDVWEKIYDEDWDDEDLEDADNWDEYEDLEKELDKKAEDFQELADEIF